jgi:hypothetical protein
MVAWYILIQRSIYGFSHTVIGMAGYIIMDFGMAITLIMVLTIIHMAGTLRTVGMVGITVAGTEAHTMAVEATTEVAGMVVALTVADTAGITKLDTDHIVF